MTKGNQTLHNCDLQLKTACIAMFRDQSLLDSLEFLVLRDYHMNTHNANEKQRKAGEKRKSSMHSANS